VIAAGAPIDVDLSKLEPGQQIIVLWQSHPVFVVNRPAAILNALREPAILASLRDPDSEARPQPRYAVNWHRSIKPEYLVLVGICTHLGCIPRFRPDVGAADLAPNWPGGYFCPCHGSKYDLAGRVFKASPRRSTCRCRPIASSTPRRCASARTRQRKITALLYPLWSSSNIGVRASARCVDVERALAHAAIITGQA
jgi:ubiquinol-cytochrome c reductase iron-sulfur subunit